MNAYFADMHIHIGRTKNGRAVKITGAKSLTLRNILKIASERKGLDLIGIIDCHSPEVLEELTEMIQCGEITEIKDGGLQFGKTTIIPGSEIEIYDEHCKGPIHVLAFFPNVHEMKHFSEWMAHHVKNIHLSSQRIYCNGKQLQQKVKELGGLFIPAHIFTPFKSLYGKGVNKSLTEVFDPTLIDAMELGLSADTWMIQDIQELQPYTFLTNSDAHSLNKLAREYNTLELKEPTFAELRMALHETLGRKVTANYGLQPKLGKYHETVCGKCLFPISEKAAVCPKCGSKTIIKGVASRIKELSEKDGLTEYKKRPPYIHQVPLEFIPGLGPKTMEKLLQAFGTEMNILHTATLEQLEQTVPEKIAGYIDLARNGKLHFEAGGGGRYGKVKLKQ
jgi:uncharacterized protein (TIGR00375 family)